MKRVLLQIEYKGTNYFGWQKQPNLITVQGVLEDALSNFFKQDIALNSSGRTDAKVHAFRQYAHFDCDTNIDISRLPYALNSFLPNDIKIKDAKQVDNNFHARFDAKKKIYQYYINNSPFNCALYNDFCFHVPQKLNLRKMKKACGFFKGEHDFTSFCAKREFEDKFHNIRKIYYIKMSTKNNIIKFEVCGNGFLYNMVRIIIGTIIDVGKGKIAPQEIKKILLSKDRASAGQTAEPQGLILFDVKY